MTSGLVVGLFDFWVGGWVGGGLVDFWVTGWVS